MKAVLIDTHALLWWIAGDRQLSTKARQAIATRDCYFSLAGCWEAAIKTSLGKLQLDRPLAQFLKEELSVNGIALLPIDFRHVMRVAQLPFHHRDPFDRLLIAQAMEEELSLVSSDSQFDGYEISRIW
uniref:PilT protein domain protein n=1 Tax=Solibacter usitatus (strain Ellin6076) TaxID=234267 RepID=Q023U9_SOLUE